MSTPAMSHNLGAAALAGGEGVVGTLGIAFAFGTTSGGHVNPARSLGVAWFAGSDALAQVREFILAPVLGAAIAGVTHSLIGGVDSSDSLFPSAGSSDKIPFPRTSTATHSGTTREVPMTHTIVVWTVIVVLGVIPLVRTYGTASGRAKRRTQQARRAGQYGAGGYFGSSDTGGVGGHGSGDNSPGDSGGGGHSCGSGSSCGSSSCGGGGGGCGGGGS